MAWILLPLKARKPVFKIIRDLPHAIQTTASYLLPVRRTVEDILKKLDEKIASPEADMRAKKLLKLFPPPNVQSRRYCKFKGDSAPQFLKLTHCTTELEGIQTYDNFDRTYVGFTCFEVEEVEGISEGNYWRQPHGWTGGCILLCLLSLPARRRRRGTIGFFDGAQTLMMMTRTAFVLRINLVLKFRDVILSKIAANITYACKMEVSNATICALTELLPSDLVVRTAEKSNRVLHDEVIRKVFSFCDRDSSGLKVHRD